MNRVGLCAKFCTNRLDKLCFVSPGTVHCTFSSSCGLQTWDLASAVCLERKPIITKKFMQIERTFYKHIAGIDLEKSFKCDHEMRHEQDRRQAEMLKKGTAHDLDLDQTMKQTAQDFEDLCQEEFNKFQLTPRISEADKNHEIHSLDRKQDSHLLLLVKQKLGENYVWLLPQGLRQHGETMRQTAERVLKESCGNQIQVLFLGNSPCGVYKYKYPKEIRDNSDGPKGAKVFFFKAQHVVGEVEYNKSLVQDFSWLTREELLPSLHKDYHNCVSQFLIDEY